VGGLETTRDREDHRFDSQRRARSPTPGAESPATRTRSSTVPGRRGTPSPHGLVTRRTAAGAERRVTPSSGRNPTLSVCRHTHHDLSEVGQPPCPGGRTRSEPVVWRPRVTWPHQRALRPLQGGGRLPLGSLMAGMGVRPSWGRGGRCDRRPRIRQLVVDMSIATDVEVRMGGRSSGSKLAE
jgi:hypothetical protein